MKAFIKKINSINFGLMSPDNIREMSVVTVEYPDTYGDDGFPIDKGLMDPRLGIIDPSLVCRTCGSKGGICQGHFGSIELARPVIHVGFGDVIHKILRSTCNECGRALLTDDQIKEYTQKILELKSQKESIAGILKKIYGLISNECEECPHCGAIQDKIILDKPVSIVQHISPFCEFRKLFLNELSSEKISIAEIGPIANELVVKKEDNFKNKLIISSNFVELLCEHLNDADEIIKIADLKDDIDKYGEYCELNNSQLISLFEKVVKSNGLIDECKLNLDDVDLLSEFTKVFSEDVNSNKISIVEIGPIAKKLAVKKEDYFQNELIVNSNFVELLCEHLNNADEVIKSLGFKKEIDEYYELTNNQLSKIFKKIVEDNDLIEECNLTDDVDLLSEFKEVFFKDLASKKISIAEIGSIAKKLVVNKEDYFQNELLIFTNFIILLCEHLNNADEIIESSGLNDADEYYEVTVAQLKDIFKNIADSNNLIDECKLTDDADLLSEFKELFFKDMESEKIGIAEIGPVAKKLTVFKEDYFKNKLLLNTNLIERLCEYLHDVDKIIEILDLEQDIDEYYDVSASQLTNIFKSIVDENGLTEDYKLTASEVRERLEKIPDEDSFVLGVNPEVARPEWLVLTVLPVPPVTVRPSIILDTGERSEDDLTHKLVDILRINQRLLENMEAGAPQLIVEDLWELLQYHVTTYFDNEASGVPPARHRSGRPLKTLTQRLKGKEGRFRSNLSGKRVNFSARTVISPDPNISINEVGVPEMIAKEVTVPVYVNEWNIDEMRTYIENGPDVHPGANYVINGDKKRRVTDETKEFILENLEPGLIIERHLKDGDMVLFNRQPSLHRMSMMAHEVRVLPYKTFRLNLCVCPPYNADFDGDEMNMHVFQTDESRAEAKSLMRVQEHILSPRFGGPIIGAIHDHISGAYLLTRDGVEFTEEQALQIIRKSHLKIPEFKSNQWILKYDPDFGEESFIYKDKGDKWTGKELFSLLLPNDLNLQYAAEISKGKQLIKEKDNDTGIEKIIGVEGIYPPQDGYVIIENGILKQGTIDESAYGSFSGRILDKIVKQYGPGRAKEFLDRSTDLAICGIMKTGITTSLNDEEIPEEAQDRINEHLNNKMAEVDKLVEAYEEGYLEALPGRSLSETLEMKIMQVLGEARDISGEIAEHYLNMGKQYPEDPYAHVMAVENHSVVMARTGARASMLNLTQITACVGQQAVRGGRIERGYIDRTLPHFKKRELGAKAKGFVHSSYKSGLDPIEFFFHAMGGREGLVDTAIRTAQSGYMQRRLVNALQDLQVKPSGLVTDNQGNVIQNMFGEDGVDPAKSDFGKAADLDKLIDEIRMEGK